MELHPEGMPELWRVWSSRWLAGLILFQRWRGWRFWHLFEVRESSCAGVPVVGPFGPGRPTGHHLSTRQVASNDN